MKACTPLVPTRCSSCFFFTFSLIFLLTLLPSPSLQARVPHLTLSFSDHHKKSWIDTAANHGMVYFSKRLILSRLLGGRDEEKAQMGSRPPTCDSKCNNCKPCQAVQVPTTPQAKLPLNPSNRRINNTKDKQGNLTASAQLNSNYKPEGWKCTCGNKFFNP